MVKTYIQWIEDGELKTDSLILNSVKTYILEIANKLYQINQITLRFVRCKEHIYKLRLEISENYRDSAAEIDICEFSDNENDIAEAKYIAQRTTKYLQRTLKRYRYSTRLALPKKFSPGFPLEIQNTQDNYQCLIRTSGVDIAVFNHIQYAIEYAEWKNSLHDGCYYEVIRKKTPTK